MNYWQLREADEYFLQTFGGGKVGRGLGSIHLSLNHATNFSGGYITKAYPLLITNRQ
jgi:hypothetical protein